MQAAGRIVLNRTAHPVEFFAAAPAGTAAVAMRDGVVEQTLPEYKERWIGHMGRQPVLIRHEDGSAILYGHLKNVTLKPGDTVRQGEKLGECSNSGDTWVSGVGVIHYSVYPVQ